MDTVEIQGETYIRAQDAAKEVGYTGDYVGQLSRSGKIVAKQVGRAWYVREGELVRHKSGKSRSNLLKTRQSIQESRDTDQSSQTGKNNRYTTRFVPAFRQKLLDVQVNYEKDEMPLLPTIKKRGEGENIKHLSVKVEAEKIKAHGSSKKIAKTNSVDTDHAKKRLGPLKEGIVHITSLDEDGDVYELVPDASEDKIEIGKSDPEIIQDGPHTTFSEKIALAELREQARGKKHESKVAEKMVTETSDFAKALMPILLVLLLTVVIANTFLHNVWLYESGSANSLEKSQFHTKFGITPITIITSKISR